jgi:hypothetical protein
MRVQRRLLVGLSVTVLAAFGAIGMAPGVGAAEAVPFAYTGASQTYTMPSDVCSVTIDVVGANGGGITNTGPGVGGTAQATFPVLPGDVLTVDVGGAGGDPTGGTGAAATYGGGGAGGTSTATIPPGGGGAGGGATTVTDNGSVLLVAGGGGGATPYSGSGGNGGDGGSAGADGTGAGGNSGGPGLGGTTSAGGAGGAAGGSNATAGTAGTAGTGGTGGNTTNSFSSAGGGGGGGYFGGGGGGGADDGGSGGGGGGGAGFAAGSATGLTTSSLTQDNAGNGVAQITPAAGTCPPTLTVQKQVSGPVPAGTTFTVQVQCSHASQTTVDTDVTFDAAGNPIAGNPMITAELTDTCNVTETASGGAQSVGYACSDNAGTAPSYCQSTNQDVQFGRTLGETATVTVTNTFPAPPPVAIAPKFTG